MRWFWPDGFVGDDPISKHNARILALIILAFIIVVSMLATLVILIGASPGIPAADYLGKEVFACVRIEDGKISSLGYACSRECAVGFEPVLRLSSQSYSCAKEFSDPSENSPKTK